MQNREAAHNECARAIIAALVESQLLNVTPIANGVHPDALIRRALREIDPLLAAYAQAEADKLAASAHNWEV